MSSSIEAIKANYQEILKRKLEEQQAEVALNIITEYERAKERFESLQGFVTRLEQGENPNVVVRDFYGEDKGIEARTANAMPYGLGGRY
jgi:hypothetical protein